MVPTAKEACSQQPQRDLLTLFSSELVPRQQSKLVPYHPVYISEMCGTDTGSPNVTPGSTWEEVLVFQAGEGKQGKSRKQ